MTVMFDPNIPGGFPSGYGGASGAETGLVGGGGGGAMSGAAGAAGGFLTVLGATQGLGPWQGISDFFDSTFNSSSKLRRHAEAAAPRDWLSQSIGTYLSGHGLGTYKTEGKGASLGGTPAAKRANKLSEIVRKAQEKYPGLPQAAYAEMFKPGNIHRFMPSISIDDAIEARKQELLNPEQNPEWIRITEELKSGKIKGKGINNARAALGEIQNKAASLRENLARNPNYVPKELKAGKGSNLGFKFGGRQTDMTMEGFFKNLEEAIDNNTFLPEWARQTIPVPDATFTGEDPRLTDAGQYTPEMPTVQDPEPTPEPGLITEPTPVETPTEPPTETPSDQGLFSDEAIAQFFTEAEQEAIVTDLEKAKATQADADATPSDKNNAWGKVAFGLAAGAGLFGLSKLFQPRNGETTDGDINNLPRLNLNLPSSNRLGLNFSNTGGLTPVPPVALSTLPTGVQSGGGIPLGKFEYKDDYVGYPLL